MSASAQQAAEPSEGAAVAAVPPAGEPAAAASAPPAAEAKAKRAFTWTEARKKAFQRLQEVRAEQIQQKQLAREPAAPKTPATAAADPVAALILGPDAQSTKPSAKSTPTPATSSSSASSTNGSTTPASSATTPPAEPAAPPAAPSEPLVRSEELPKEVGDQKVTLTYRELVALAREGMVPLQSVGEPKKPRKQPVRRPTRRHADDDLMDSSTEESEDEEDEEEEEAPPRRRARAKSTSGKETLGRAPPKPLGIASSLRGYGAGAGSEPKLVFLS